MKKFLKIFFISVGSLLATVLIIICIVLWLVFTPKRFTPIVRKQADKFLTCKSETGEVELTFFSTFPNFGLKVKNFALINPTAGAQSDTLVKVNEFVAVIDAKAYWKRNEIILIGLEMSGGSVNVYADSLGKTNYDIFPADTSAAPAPETETALPFIDIKNVEFNNVNLSYNDQSIKVNTVIGELKLKLSGTISADSIAANINVSNSKISFDYAGEKYLNEASVELDLPLDVIMSRQFIKLKNAGLTVNGLELLLSGTVENDTVNKNMITDLNYSFSSWQLKNVLALVPPSYNSYFKGIDADGIISSQGTIKGIMNDKTMPMLDIQLQMDKGVMKYSGFPLPLHDIAGDIAIHTDLKTDAISFVTVKKFSARTPLSSFSTEGKVNHIFGDIYCDLTTTAGLTLDEFNQMIPASMKMKGNASGRIRSAFSMSQIEKMQLEKIRLSGSVTFSDFSATYDSISMSTGRTKIDFSLPNKNPASGKTKFASASFIIDNLTVGKIDSYNAYLKNATLSLETSDARDTTRIPDLLCAFSMDSLSAGMDTVSINISRPTGKMEVSPRSGSSDEPEINLAYTSGQLSAVAGQSSFSSKAINLETEIINDNKQKDIFLQWLVKGFVDMNQGKIIMEGLSNSIDIPSLKMNFDPEKFNIKESKLVIDKSDFQLTGTLNNILSYFRGDSILRGDFTFLSNNTDVSQLMALTNGIGNADSAGVKQPETQSIDTSYTGPYMVPKRVDLFLATSIKRATIGIDTATNIKGSVQVHDGILVLDGLSFTTPAAKMQLTAMYRTPRKNHLYLGLDYHMLDIEIEQLLKMIPDIDSIMPMLRSFKGKGEFHIAVETYLDSMYNVKKSTLRGASSIRGTDLVLMDGQTFSEIAKTLMFKKKTENKVDSLSVEFTIFRNEIDIYPFLIVMDKYKAVIAGRHNLDMSFNYHISVVDCPLPIKLGIDVKGNENNLKYNLAKCRYAEYFRPASRHEVENKQIELRKLIRDALTQKVK